MVVPRVLVSKEGLEQAIHGVEKCRVQSECVELLRVCGNLGALEEGRRMHAVVARDGSDRETFIGNLLVQMYGNCGSIAEARAVFGRIGQKNLFSWSILVGAFAQTGHLEEAKRLFQRAPQINVISWNTMLAAFAQKGHLHEAEDLFGRMPEKDVVSWNTMISAYAQNGHLEQAIELFLLMDLEGIEPSRVTFLNVLQALDSDSKLKAVHTEISLRGFHTNVIMGSALIKVYGICQYVEQAKSVFNQIWHRNIVNWITLAEAFSRSGCLNEACHLFEQMPFWDVVAWTNMVTAYARNGHLQDAVRIFTHMPERNIVTWNAMLAAAASQAEDIRPARKIFAAMPELNVVSWTTMVTAYAQKGHSSEAFGLLRRMDIEGAQPNEVTLFSVMDACNSPEALDFARHVHQMLEEAPVPASDFGASVISMYGRCCSLEDAKEVFFRLKSPKRAAWNAIISALVETKLGREAVALFRKMDLEGVLPDKSTLLSIFEGCSSASEGKIIHSSICSSNIDHLLFDIAVATSLLYMHGKHGNVAVAKSIFDRMQYTNTVTWTALISSYAQNGHGRQSLELFRMAGLDGMLPDGITFTKVLVACSHAGLLDHGYHFFTSLVGDYHISPDMEHYNCIIDLLVRTGRLSEAQDVAINMPFEPNVVSWVTLLGGCRVHQDPVRAVQAAERAVEIDEDHTAPLTLLYSTIKS